jgi:hypothetical protein
MEPATWKADGAPHFSFKNGDTKRQVLMVFKIASTKEAEHNNG